MNRLMSSALALLVSLAASSSVAHSSAARVGTLPGFNLVGENWTYDPGDGGAVITGKLIQPTTGTSPHPAVLISHGQGGSAAGFSAQKAAVMKTWGLVCIAPDYTHVTTVPPGTDGWSAENERRARACLAILASLDNVDTARIAAYGNSKGAYLTAGLCGATAPGEIRAAAITAGGTSGTTDTTPAAPATQEVQGITTPFLMLHGTADTTVQPIQSQLLKAILDGNSVPNARYLWNGVGHNLHQDEASAVYELMRAWFSEFGVLGSAGNTRPTLSSVPNQTTPVDTPSGALAVAIGDGQTAAAALTVSAFSLNEAVVAQGGIALGGSGANRTLTLTPLAGQSGVVQIVVAVSDGELDSVTSFTLTVGDITQTPMCAGDGVDPAVTTACPCANFGAVGRGCASSVNAFGALLTGSGSSNPDTLVLAASGMPATTTSIFLQGDARSDLVFGDGVRCAGGALIRLRTKTNVNGASQFPQAGDPSVSVRGNVTPGSGVERIYQTYYRNAAAAFCPPLTFNVSNGWSVVW